MRKLVYLIFFFPLFIAGISTSCSDDDNSDIWNDYKDWREKNDAWLTQQAALSDPSGKAYYKRIVPSWNPGVYVLMHNFSDPAVTEGNLVPLMSSTVTVKYKGELYNSVPFDSSYTRVDSLYTTKLTNVIEGWQIALQYMHVGDSVDVVIPYFAAYGTAGSASIPPYSALKFSIKLVDIPGYEKR
ncbi:MAG: FKBP-type peptidyl-prolyl cis-trans isomerase [Muribaculaceae bacterium]|nr:FKBP-type peptidyl-prolyl cis-trans isomerase [Muribaculaceae bacterium]